MKKLNYIAIVIGVIILFIVSALYLDSNILNITSKVINIKTEIINKEKPSYEYLKSITVYIEGESIKRETNSEGKLEIKVKRWIGTGTIIKIKDNYTYILTNAHVAGKGLDNIALFIENGLREIEAEIVKYSEKDSIDLAVIKVNSKLKGKREVKGIGDSFPSDSVYLVGHHLGRKYVYGEGVFAGYQNIYDIIQIPTLFGNSGTGVCNSQGKLVSVIFAINRVGFFNFDSAHGIAINSNSIKIFLRKLGLLE